MRVAVVAIFALVVSGSAAAQLGGSSSSPQAGTTATPHGGPNETLSARSGLSRLYDANGHMSERDYRALLARQMAAAQALVGQTLTDRDRKKIRSAISSDLIAWRKQYDPRRADYGAMRERWLVDEASLSPEAWAKQRLDWLRAQQAWILANIGELDAQASRAR
jgi:hypothetical protein